MNLRLRLAICIGVGLALVCPVAGQSPGDALSSLLQKLPADERAPQTLLRLSRMAPEPRGQIDWLLEQAQAVEQGAARQALIAGIEGRLAAFEKMGVGRRDADWMGDAVTRLAALKPTAPNPQPDPDPKPVPPTANLLALLAPAELSAAIKAGASFEGLTDSARFQLTARGVPVTRFRSSAGRMGAPQWDLPRVIFSELTGGGQLPGAEKLLRIRREARQNATKAAPEFRPVYEVLGGLVDRALGVTPATQDWSGIASRLNAENAWLWSAAASWLASDTAAASAAWSKYSAVQRELGAGAVSEPWARFAASAAAFDTAARQAAEQAARSGNKDAALQAMQRAKMSEAGVSGAPMSLSELTQALSPVGAATLFVEMLAVAEDRWYGVALHPRLNDASAGDTYLENLVGPAPSPTALGQQIAQLDLKNASNPLILIACDGPLPKEWFSAELALFEKLKGQPGVGRVAYLPSATALRPGGWTLDQAARAWYQSGMRRGLGPIDLGGSTAAPIGGTGLTVRYIAWDDAPSSASGQLADFMKRKLVTRQPELAGVMPTVVSR